MLSNTTGPDNQVIRYDVVSDQECSSLPLLLQLLRQVYILIKELCKLHNLLIPPDLEKSLFKPIDGHSLNAINDFPYNQSSQISDEEEEEDEEMGDEDLHIEMEEENQNQDKNKDEGLSTEHTATLERLRQNQRDGYLKGSVSGSVQATDRLMKVQTLS